MITATVLDAKTSHICQDAFLGISTMKEAYTKIGSIPTSTNADTFLIRSHIAYWTGAKEAERAVIRPSRGHSYKITVHGMDYVVKIRDYYDHRNGVIGWSNV